MGCEDAAIRGRCGLDPFISIKTAAPCVRAVDRVSPAPLPHPARNAGFGSTAGILKDMARSSQPSPEVTSTASGKDTTRCGRSVPTRSSTTRSALHDAGALRPVLDRTFGFDETLEANAYVERGRAKDKVVIPMPPAGAA
jgi:hypothetical protein